MSSINPSSSSSTLCSNTSFVSCETESSDLPVKASVGGTILGVKARDASGVGVTAGEFEALAGDATLVRGTVADVSVESDLGLSARMSALEGSVGFGVRDDGETVESAVSAEIDVLRVQGTFEGDSFSVRGGIGVGAGFHIGVSASDKDQDGNVEYCVDVGGGIIGKFDVKACLEMPAEKSTSQAKPRPSVTGFNLRANR